MPVHLWGFSVGQFCQHVVAVYHHSSASLGTTVLSALHTRRIFVSCLFLWQQNRYKSRTRLVFYNTRSYKMHRNDTGERNNADVVLKFSCGSRNSTWQKTYNTTANPIRFQPLPRFSVTYKGENVSDELPETKFNPFFLLVCEYLKTLCKRLPLLQPDSSFWFFPSHRVPLRDLLLGD